MLQRDQDTICAVSTPQGQGGISVIRVSGPRAVEISKKLCSFIPEQPESHRAYFGSLFSADKKSTIDEVIALLFLNGRSFTGEEVVEISCHGNPVIVQWILRELVHCGARLADRGEFTYRAFMHGRLDLVQAESVLSLIESQTQQSAQQSLRQLKGQLSIELEKAEDDVTWCLAHLEASIDFSQEGLEVVTNEELKNKLNRVQVVLNKLVRSYEAGRILKEGLNIVLAGVPNVGKSSLLNALMGEEKAIVTDVPGTTRDLVEGAFILNGVRALVTDTAGLREAQDKVEKIGIEKSRERQKAADLVLFVFDATKDLDQEEVTLLASMNPSQVVVIGNKSDLVSKTTTGPKKKIGDLLKSKPEFSNFFNKIDNLDRFLSERVFFISTFDMKNIDELKGGLAKILEAGRFEDQTLLMQARHYESLQRAQLSLTEAMQLVERDASAEFIALELKQALLQIQEVLGKRFDDQIMDRVFKEFCIGK